MTQLPRSTFFGTARIVVWVGICAAVALYVFWPSDTAKTRFPDNSTSVLKGDAKKAEHGGLNQQTLDHIIGLSQSFEMRNITLIAVRHGFPVEKVHLIAEQDYRDSLQSVELNALQLPKKDAMAVWAAKLKRMAAASELSEKEVAMILWDLSLAKQ